jgi:hypothetical protein
MGRDDDLSKIHYTYDPGASGRLSILEHMYIERGGKSDWESLSELHYKGKSTAAGARFWRCVYKHEGVSQLVGIIVFANPMPLNKGRNMVFPNLKPNQRGGRDTRTMNQQRMKYVNDNICWSNRTVVDTMFRSAGIAYRFKNLAYRMNCCEYGLRFVESNSSMGKFNPFLEKCGMKFVKPKHANALDAGIDFFTNNFRSHPCDQAALMEELEAMQKDTRAVVEKKLREFYQKNSSMEKSGDKMHVGMTRVNSKDIRYILKQASQIVFGATIYWIWENPEGEWDKRGGLIRMNKMPARLPLLAFDNQDVNAPLNTDKLKSKS